MSNQKYGPPTELRPQVFDEQFTPINDPSFAYFRIVSKCLGTIAVDRLLTRHVELGVMALDNPERETSP
jgi:hypothetical protein